MSIISDSMLRNNDSDRASAQYASSQPYSQTYSDEGSSNDNQQGLLERIFNGLGAASDWIGNNVEYVENSPAGQWIGNNVEYVENSPVGQAVSQTLGQALAPANSIFQNWPALLGLAANAAVTPKDDDAYGGSLYNAGVNGAASTIGSIADLMHQDDLAAAMYTLANRTQDDTPVQADLDWDYITNPHGLTRSVGNAIGSMVPLLPAAALAPESLVAAAGRFSPWLANGVRYGFTAIPEAMAEGGQTRREAIEDGLDHPDLRAFGTLAKNLPLLAASNTLEGAILGGGLGKALAGKAGEGVFSRVAKAPFRATPSALAEGLQNGLEEGLQQGIQNASVDKEYGYLPWNWTDDQWDAAKEGFFGTLPLGGIGGARKAIFSGAGGVATAPENGPDNTDPVVMAQLTGKNDDVPTADGVDVTNLDPQQYTQWYGEKLKSQGIDVPDATITVQTPKVQQTSGAGGNAKSSAPSYDASALEGAPRYTVSGEVSSTDVTPLTDQKMRLLDSAYYNKYGQHLYITSMKRNGNGDSWHDSGQAFDTADDNLANNKEARDWLVSEGEKLGLTPLDEYENPSAHATGGHIHFSDHGDPIPEGATQNTQAQNTQETANSGGAPAADLSSLPVGDIATAIAQNTGLPANFIWAQLSHESDGGNSKLAREDHNYGGVKGNDGEYLHFDNDQQFIDYMSNYYPKYREDGIYDAQTADQFAEALQHGGYFTADLGEYEGGMHRYLEQAGLSDSGTAGAPSEKRSGGDNANTMTQQQFGDMLNEKMIDFAGTNDDTVKVVFNDMSTSKDKALVALFAPYMQDGAFANTAANREALVGNDGFKKAMAMFLSKHLSDYAPAFENGRISFQQAEDALRPRHQQDEHAVQTPNIQTSATPQALIQMVQKGLNRKQQGALLQAANTALHTPQGMANGDEAVWMNKLAKAIDEHDYPTIAQMIPNESMQALSAPKQGAPISMANTVMNPAGQTETEQAQFTQNAPANVVAMPAAQAPTNADTKNRVSSKVQGDAPVRQQATAERQAPQSEVASTVQGNIPVQQVAAIKSETPQGEVASAVEANMPANQAPVRMNNQQTEQQAAPKKQSNVTPLPTQEAQQSEGVRIAQPQPTIDEQNAQMGARIADIKKQPLAQRKALGQQYLDTLRQNNVSFSEKKLAKPLMDGEPEALEHVQRTYGDLLNTITPAETAAASQHTAPRTIQAATTARLANMVSEITSGNTYKNASPVGKLAYLAAASGHAKTVGADESVKAINSIIADVRKKAGFSGKGTTEGMTPEQKDEFYNTFYKQSLDDATAIRKEAKDEKPANLKSLDNTIEMFKQELANSKPAKEARKEVTHESTQSKNQQKPDESAKNQDQHTKPEPRKAAGTQRKAEEGEVKKREVRDKYYESVISDPRWKEIENELTPDGVKRMEHALELSTSAHQKKIYRTIEHYKLHDTWFDYRGFPHSDMGLGAKDLREPQHGAFKNIRKIAALQDKVDAIMADHYQDSDNKKAADDGGQAVVTKKKQKADTKNLDSTNVPAMGEPIRGRTGKETTVVTDSGKEIRVRYRLVPSYKVITSHDAETMVPNKAYPQELQPRDRQRVSMQEQVTAMANELRPADLGAGRNLNQGAPIIRKDGVILNGNGRAMAIQKARAMKGKSATAYNKYVAEHAQDFGFDRSYVMGLKKYMLVREVVDDIDTDTMQDIIGSTAGGSRMGASEQAKADAKKIKPRDLDSYVDNEQGDLTTAANQNFVANILYRIVSKNERNAYTDEHGNVNADGIQRVKRALFSLAYNDDGLIDKMAESTDDNIRNVSRGLMSAAPAFARVNLAVKDGQAYEYDAGKTISDAVKHLDALRREGKPVKDYLNEQSMFSEYQDTDEVREVLRFFDENKRSGKRIGIFLNDMAKSILEQGSPNQTSLMDGGRATLGEIIKSAERVARDGTTAASLFDNAQKAPAEEKPEEATNEKKDESIFGSVEDADKEMLDALGLSEEDLADDALTAPSGIKNTAEEREKLEKELAAELNKLSANPVFNPKIYTLGLKLAMTYVKDGINTVKKLVAKLNAKFGDKIGPWAPALAETVRTWPKGVPFDEKKVMAISKAVGARYENGITSLDDMQADMKKLLKGQHDSFAPMIEASYNGIRKFFEAQKGESDHVDDSTSGLAERAGRGSDSDRVGPDDAGGESGRGSGRGVQETERAVQPEGSARVRDRSAVAGGETGNRGVQAEESGDRAGSAGSAHVSRSVRDSYEGSVGHDADRNAADVRTAQNRRDNASPAGARARAVKPNKSGKRGDLGSIKNDLPMLKPEQQEDVEFIETRVNVNNKPGVMLTNGTGTGKTYSGLGFVKRMYDAGKKNILIVSPGESINDQWIEAASKHFDLSIEKLDSTKDSGKDGGICITTYANLQANRELVNRNWDAVVSDESHTLMQNEKGEETGYLSMLRALTLNPRGAYKRFKLQHRTKEIRALENQIEEREKKAKAILRPYKDKKKISSADKAKIDGLQKEIEDLNKEMEGIFLKMSPGTDKLMQDLKAAYPEEKRPKVLFLSATPFSHDKDIDYAEGYLFNYDDQPNTGAYNQGTPFDRFMVKHFGYRMRTNKLTRPDAEVDSRAMEVQFHDDLVNSGAMHGRQIDVDKDYDRGFILVDGGIGHKIDEGFKFLSDNHAAYGELQQALMKQFNKSQQKYLIESIKAREVIPLIQEYVKKGKKVVLFHQSMVEHKNIHPFQLKASADLAENSEVWAQWKAFKSARPDLVNLSLGNIPAPMETLRKELGGHAVFINGSVLKKDRAKNIEQFNDDNSGVNIIVCQQDAANAGISLHDTTGKHPRVLINIAMPERPSYAMQIEGRIYRVGNASNAVFRYLSTGTDIEKNMFASTIGGRAASVENLAVGNAARGLRESFRDLYQETMDGSWKRRLPGAEGEGTGGKEMDYAVTADLSEYDRAKSFYFSHQKRTAATKAQEGNDYFATPEPIGYKMVEWLGLKSGEKALEPSAGHGAISRWFPETTERTIVEPSGKLMPLAQMNTPGAKAVHGSFEDFNIINKFDGIAMNPPYGTGGKTAIEHLQKAFKQLHDGGRVVAIIPEGPAADKRYSKMMEEISSEVVPIADIHLPAVAFSRAGTKVGTHIVVLDRYTGKAAHQAALDHFGGADDINLRGIDNIKDLFDRMENMTLPERYDASNAHRAEPVPTPAVQLDEARVEGAPDETPNFTADEYEHTKTHEVKFRARPKSFLGENYRPIQKLAKAHGGYYSKFAKNSFLFEDEDERNTFLQEAEALLSDGKASAKGSVADMAKHIEFPAAGTLTEREKAMQEFGQQMGVRVVFFDGPANLRGFYNKGITFINRSTSKSPSWVFWHENLHWLRSNNPELYRQMVDYISGRQEFSPEQLQAYRDAIGRPELTDEDTIEEMLADAMPDVHKRVDLFRKMGRENKSLIQRFFGWLRDTMAAFHNAFSQPKYGLSKTQVQAMRNALANIADDLRDGEGRRIFRTRGADREILTAQGEELSYPVPDDNTKYSADKRDKEPAGSPSRMRRALVKLGLSTEQLKNVELRQAKGKQLDDISGWDMLAKSVRQVARKSPAVQYIYRLGRKALDEQEHLRNFYAQEIRKFNQYVKNPKVLEEVAQLLWEGDATGHAYTGDELQAMGVSVEAGRAYNLVRRVLADAYKRVNEARMQVKVRTEVIGRNDYREFIASHFLKPEDVLKAEMLRNGSMRVTYRGAKVYSKNEEVVSSEVYNRLRKDKDVYVKYADANDDGTYTIGYTERVKPIHKLEGYMPHFFHHFMVYEKTTGDDGKEILVSLGSANSLKKATDLANQYAKANPEGQFVIRPHSFEYDEDYNNVVVGDKDYMKMMMQITKHTEMTLPEANAFLHDSVGVTKKGRHRFFGNAQHRKGAKGFDKDVQWALTHYLNASARYVAMEHFKPEAISFYERFFGDFNAEPKSNTARYIKNFINDMNGVPSYIEDELNKIVANIPFFGSRLNDAFEGRPALALSSSISWFNAVTKLGLGNFASAAINFMQFINIGTRLNSYAYANMGLKKALKPSDFDRRIIEESGVMDEVNLASDAGGYTQTRDYGRARKGLSKVKKGLDLAMIPFTKADSLMRKAAILGAYYQGVQEKGMKPEHDGEISRKAIEYAKDVNYDANFDYSTAAAPGAMRAGSVLTQQLFQFQKYPIMQFEFFWNNVVHAKNNKQRARFLVPYLLMSGAVGAVPFGALINAVASSLVGAGGDDDNDLAEEIKAEMMKWAGTDPMKRRLVNTVLYGILANANINISERVGMSNAFSGEYYGNKPQSSAGALLQLFGGPLVSTVYNVATQIGNHNPIETIKAVSPSLGNMLQAVVGETRTTHHRIGTVYEDMYSRVMHGLGFRSVDETNNSFVNSYLYKQQKQAQEDRKDAMDAYIRDPSSENSQRMTSLGVTDKTFKTYKENANKSAKERSQSEKKTKSKKPQTEAQKESSRLKDFTK